MLPHTGDHNIGVKLLCVIEKVTNAYQLFWMQCLFNVIAWTALGGLRLIVNGHHYGKALASSLRVKRHAGGKICRTPNTDRSNETSFCQIVTRLGAIYKYTYIYIYIYIYHVVIYVLQLGVIHCALLFLGTFRTPGSTLNTRVRRAAAVLRPWTCMQRCRNVRAPSTVMVSSHGQGFTKQTNKHVVCITSFKCEC